MPKSPAQPVLLGKDSTMDQLLGELRMWMGTEVLLAPNSCDFTITIANTITIAIYYNSYSFTINNRFNGGKFSMLICSQKIKTKLVQGLIRK